MRIFKRPKAANGDSSETEFLWGVPRREGHSDSEDPLAHAGIVQHAFEFGRDDRAICGFEPPKRPSRAYRDPRPQLAVPGRDNPRCRRCELLVASRTRDEEIDAMADVTPQDGRPRNGPAHEETPREQTLIGEAPAVRDGTEEVDEPAADGQAVDEQAVDDQRAVDEQAADEQIAASDQLTAELTRADEPAAVDEPAAAGQQTPEATVEREARDEPRTAAEDRDAAREKTLDDARAPGFRPRSAPGSSSRDNRLIH